MRKAALSRLFVFSLSLLIIISLLLTGCTDGGKVGLEQNKSSNTVLVTDSAGRTVNVPEKVNKIGCLYAFSGHVVAMLGKGPNVVAVVEGLKRDKLLTQMVPTIKDTMTPVSSGAINIEELIKADPDIVFVQTDTASNPGEVEKLQKTGIPFLVVAFNSIKEQQFAIEMIGKAIGAEDKAKEYIDYYNSCIKQVLDKADRIPESQKLRLYHSVNEAARTDTRNTLPADWIEVTGAINVSVDKNLKLIEDKHFASLEQIYLWDPEVIMANESGVADYILTNKQWAGLKAVKDRKVYQMPNGISRWGHPGSLETPLAVLWTAKTLYPEMFTEINMAAETKAFYKEFFNFELTDEDVTKILAGKGMRISKGSKG